MKSENLHKKLFDNPKYLNALQNMHDEMIGDIMAAGDISEEDAIRLAIAIIREEIRHVKRDMSVFDGFSIGEKK